MEVKVENKTKVRKVVYWKRLNQYLDEYKNILVIGADFVGSNQMNQTRIMLRGKGKLLMGKNTIIRKVFRERAEKQPGLEALLPAVYGNIGFVFTNGDLNELRKMVTDKKVPAAAKVGVIAQCDVVIPAGPTGLDPGQTNFFQVLNIGSKIAKGSIEMTQATTVTQKGVRVSSSAVALLNKLNIKPFAYGITTSYVMEGNAVYPVSVLDMKPSDLVNKFVWAANQLASLSYALGEANLVTLAHGFGKAFKLCAAVGLESGYIFDEMKIVKEMIDNPDKFGGGGAVAAPVVAGAGAPPAAKKPEPEPEEEEAAPAASMFGGDGGDY